MSDGKCKVLPLLPPSYSKSIPFRAALQFESKTSTAEQWDQHTGAIRKSFASTLPLSFNVDAAEDCPFLSLGEHDVTVEQVDRKATGSAVVHVSVALWGPTGNLLATQCPDSMRESFASVAANGRLAQSLQESAKLGGVPRVKVLRLAKEGEPCGDWEKNRKSNVCEAGLRCRFHSDGDKDGGVCEFSYMTTTTTLSSVCPKCGITKFGKRSCCARGGSWFGKCGDSKVFHTWVEGLESCKDTTASPVATAVTSGCPKCGTNKNGKRSCCSRGGSWFGKCGDLGDSNFDHTWFEGLQSCKDKTTVPCCTTAVTSGCPMCGTNNAGKRTCCARGGTWFGKCGDVGDSNFDHTWVEGVQSCKDTSTMPPDTTAASGCPKCGTNKAGKLSCCSRGGSWFGKCGDAGDSNFDHTWVEGVRSCSITRPVDAEQQKAKHPEMVQDTILYKRTTTRQTETGYGFDAGMMIHANSGSWGNLASFVEFILFCYSVFIIRH